MTHFPIRDEGVQTIYLLRLRWYDTRISALLQFQMTFEKIFWNETVNPIFVFYSPFWMSFTLTTLTIRIENEKKNLAICFYLNILHRPWCFYSMKKNKRYKWKKRPEMCFLMKMAVTCQSDLLSITWTQNGIKASSIAFFGVPTMLMSRTYQTTKCDKVVHDEFLFSFFIRIVIVKCILFDAR